MKIRYRISPADYQEAQRLIRGQLFLPFLRVFAKWAWVALFAALVSLLIYAELTDMPSFENLWKNFAPLLILVAIFTFGAPILLRVLAARAYRRNPTLHREISVDLNEGGFEAEDGAGARTSMTWDYYDRFEEGKRVFVLRSLSRVFTIISKSSMNAEDLIEFRGLLTRCVVRR